MDQAYKIIWNIFLQVQRAEVLKGQSCSQLQLKPCLRAQGKKWCDDGERQLCSPGLQPLQAVRIEGTAQLCLIHIKEFVQHFCLLYPVRSGSEGRTGIFFCFILFCFPLITLEAGMHSKASQNHVSALQSENHLSSAIWWNNLDVGRVSREVTIVPSLISNAIWQVTAYYVAFLLIEFWGLKCFKHSSIVHPHQKLRLFTFLINRKQRTTYWKWR